MSPTNAGLEPFKCLDELLYRPTQFAGDGSHCIDNAEMSLVWVLTNCETVASTKLSCTEMISVTWLLGQTFSIFVPPPDTITFQMLSLSHQDFTSVPVSLSLAFLAFSTFCHVLISLCLCLSTVSSGLCS